jgi:hypothetical protein
MNFATRLAAALAAAAIAAAAYGAGNDIKMATTTSTDDSGLLKFLLPKYEAKCGCKVRYTAVGTGNAIKLGENGDVDMLMVHARAAEDKFVAEGYGVDRRDLMHNDFVLVGPSSDPAKVRGEKDVLAALKKIHSVGATFVSRGDDSGTHKKELSLWKAVGADPKGPHYLSIGREGGLHARGPRDLRYLQREDGPRDHGGGREAAPQSVRRDRGESEEVFRRELRRRDGLHRLADLGRGPECDRRVPPERRPAVLPRLQKVESGEDGPP